MKRIVLSTICAITMAVATIFMVLPTFADEPITNNGWVIELGDYIPENAEEYNLTIIQYDGGRIRFDGDFYIENVVIVVTNETGNITYKMSANSAWSNSNLDRIVTEFGWIENGDDHIGCTNGENTDNTDEIAMIGYAGSIVRIYYKGGSIAPYGSGAVVTTLYADNFQEAVQDSNTEYYNTGYNVGYNAGLNADNQTAYDQGYADALGMLDDGTFAESFLKDALFAPIQAVADFTLFTSPNGVEFTLGGIFGVGVLLVLVVMVLKFFAGG